MMGGFRGCRKRPATYGSASAGRAFPQRMNSVPGCCSLPGPPRVWGGYLWRRPCAFRPFWSYCSPVCPPACARPHPAHERRGGRDGAWHYWKCATCKKNGTAAWSNAVNPPAGVLRDRQSWQGEGLVLHGHHLRQRPERGPDALVHQVNRMPGGVTSPSGPRSVASPRARGSPWP